MAWATMPVSAALEHADHAIALLPDADDLPQRSRRAAEQGVGVLPPQHGHARLLPHIEVAEIAAHERLDVVDRHVVGDCPDHLAVEAHIADAIGELLRPAGADGHQRCRTVAQELRVVKREPLRRQLARARMRGGFPIIDDDRAAAPDFVQKLLRQRRLAAEQCEHGHDAPGTQNEAEEREQCLTPVTSRLVEPRQQ